MHDLYTHVYRAYQVNMMLAMLKPCAVIAIRCPAGWIRWRKKREKNAKEFVTVVGADAGSSKYQIHLLQKIFGWTDAKRHRQLVAQSADSLDAEPSRQKEAEGRTGKWCVRFHLFTFQWKSFHCNVLTSHSPTNLQFGFFFNADAIAP